MTTQELAISHARFARDSEDPIKTVLSCCWISLGLFYEELARAKVIEPINTLSKEKKIFYWKQTEGTRFKRIYQCFSLYLFELLNQENGGNRSVQTEDGN